MKSYNIIIIIIILFIIFGNKIETFANEFKKKRKYLLFSSVGKRDSKNPLDNWLKNDRNYDVALYYYDDTKFNQKSDYNFRKKGFKWPNFGHFIKNNDLSGYDAVFVIDDDIIMDTKDINKMFEIFMKYELKLAQPSFDKDSDIHFKIQETDNKKILDYVNWIECGVILMNNETFMNKKLIKLYSESGSGYGIDNVIIKLINPGKKDVAMIHQVSSHHPRTKKKTKSSYYFKDKKFASKTRKIGEDFMKKYNTWYSKHKIYGTIYK
jgi:hypothetical protein